MGADAVIGMRQDIDLDTNAFTYFYLQMYGTAVKFKQLLRIKEMDVLRNIQIHVLEGLLILEIR